MAEYENLSRQVRENKLSAAEFGVQWLKDRKLVNSGPIIPFLAPKIHVNQPQPRTAIALSVEAICARVWSLIYIFVYLFVYLHFARSNLFIYLFQSIYPSIYLFIYFIYFIYLFIHSFIHSIIHEFIYLPFHFVSIHTFFFFSSPFCVHLCSSCIDFIACMSFLFLLLLINTS